MTTQASDEARAEAFAGRMVDVLNGAGLALMTSIGHQVGLFDAMATLPQGWAQDVSSGTPRSGHAAGAGSARHRAGS